jgi:hypothetical protein
MKFFFRIRSLINFGNPPKSVQEVFAKMYDISFPRGDQQIAEEAEILHAVLNMKVSVNDLKKIILNTKPQFYMFNMIVNNKDVSDDFICEVPADTFQKWTKTKLLESDLVLIHRFYINYFGLTNISSETHEVEVETLDELIVVDIHGRDGYYWGSYDFSSNQFLNNNENGQKRIFQVLLLSSVMIAKHKLTNSQREIFSNIMNLPLGSWTHEHYSIFAFSLANWMIDCSTDDHDLIVIKTFRQILAGFDMIQYDGHLDSRLIPIFAGLFSNDPETVIFPIT